MIILAGFSQVNAQDMCVGFKASGNGFGYVTENGRDYSCTMNYGASLGGLFSFDISDHFSIQPELNVYYRSARLKNHALGTSDDIITCGAEIPVYAMYRWKLNSFSLNAGAGNFLRVGFVGANLTTDVDLYETEYLKRTDFGVGGTVGCTFKSGLSFHIEYKQGVINALDSLKNKNKMFSQTFEIGIGYIIACN